MTTIVQFECPKCGHRWEAPEYVKMFEVECMKCEKNIVPKEIEPKP